MAKEKLVEIVMPVGIDAGKAVKVTEEQAARLEKTFGTFREKPGAAGLEAENAALAARIAELEAAISESEGIRAEAKEILLSGSPVAFGDASIEDRA